MALPYEQLDHRTKDTSNHEKEVRMALEPGMRKEWLFQTLSLSAPAAVPKYHKLGGS